MILRPTKCTPSCRSHYLIYLDKCNDAKSKFREPYPVSCVAQYGGERPDKCTFTCIINIIIEFSKSQLKASTLLKGN